MSESGALNEVTVEITVRNSTGGDLVVVLEPRGEHYPMPDKKRFRLVGVGPPGKAISIDYGPEHLLAWMDGSALRLYDGDVEIGPDQGPGPTREQG